MKDIINNLSSHNTLSKDEAKEVLLNISKGKYNNSHISSFSDNFYDEKYYFGGTARF